MPEMLGPLVIFAAAMCLTPGPNVVMVTASAANSVVIWAGFGAAIARFLGSPRARMAFNWSMGGLLVLSLLPVFW